jgi:predicted nucleic acid-binding Zn finger protein
MKNLSEINPVNATDALRFARTLEKAKAILAAGYYFELDAELELVFVCKPGQLSAAYWIFLGEGDEILPRGCQCPDFTHRGGYCKHTLAWNMLEAEREEEERKIARYEEEEYGRAWYAERAALRG